MTAVLQVLLAYLLGAIPFAYIAGKALKGLDIRQYGSGNVGATNVFRVLGKGPGVVVLALDMAKGWAAVVLLARGHDFLLTPCSAGGLTDATWWPCLLGMAAVLGHSYTIFLGFKGGKGVATSAGVFLGLAPISTGLTMAVFALAFAWTGMVSVGSLLAAALLPFWVLLNGEKIPKTSRVLVMDCMGTDWSLNARPVFWLALVLAVLVWVKHLPNIRRILDGTENSFRKKKEPA